MSNLTLPSKTINYAQPVNWQHPLNDGLISWYKVLPQWFGGTRFRDLCGRNLGDMVGMGADSSWVRGGDFGREGTLSFSGINNHISAGTNYVDITFTLSAWVQWLRPATQTEQEAIFAKWGNAVSADNHWLLRWNSQLGRMEFFHQTGGSANTVYATDVNLSDRELHFVCATTDGSTMRQYIDGRASTFTTNTTGPAEGKTTTLDIGGDTRNGNATGGFSGGFRGEIDDARIYNRALTAIEVQQLYHDSQRPHPETIEYLPRNIYPFLTVPQPSAYAGVFQLGNQTQVGVFQLGNQTPVGVKPLA